MRRAGSSPKPTGVAHAMRRTGREHASVHLYVGEAERGAAQPSQAGDAPRGEQQTDDARGRRHERAFDHQLTNAIGACRAEGGVHGELVTAGQSICATMTLATFAHATTTTSSPITPRIVRRILNVEAGRLDERQHGGADRSGSCRDARRAADVRWSRARRRPVHA